MAKHILLRTTLALATGAFATAALAQPQPMTAKAFQQAAAESDQYEISAGQVAATETENPQVRAFAQQMIADHTQTTQALQQAGQASNLPPPDPGVGAGNAPFLAALQGQTGAAFDRAYLDQQVLKHHEALIVEQGYAANGADPNLRQAAQAATPHIRHHLEMAERLRAALGPS
jgi:putative membrane protein